MQMHEEYEGTDHADDDSEFEIAEGGKKKGNKGTAARKNSSKKPKDSIKPKKWDIAFDGEGHDIEEKR